MATNKNRINAYVGDTEYSSFTAFCEQWQCSQSKGVELMIRHFLMGESNVNGSVNGNVTDVSTDELSELKERLGKLESNVISNVNGVTEDWVKQAIADSLTNQNDLVPLDYDEGIYLKAFAVDYLGLIDPEEIKLATEKLYECGQHTVKLDNLGILEQFRTELVENWQIRHKDNYTTYRCFPVHLERAINWRAKRWGIIHRNEFVSTIEKINSRINISVPLRMFVSNTIEDSLTPILDRLNRLENYETIQVLSDDPSDFSEETPKSEPEGITASTLAPIFDEPENNPLDDSTPENDVLPIEEKLDELLSEIEGQSREVTDENTEKGLQSKELASLIGVQTWDISKWVKLRESGQTSIKGKNCDKYREFLRWEKKGDYWYLST